MDENSTKLVPLGGYPRELREKALKMYKQGYKKIKIAEILGVGNTTVRRWTNFGSHPYFKPHPLEDKQKAIDLAKSGVSRKEIAERLGISYFTIVFWCRGINIWQKQPELLASIIILALSPLGIVIVGSFEVSFTNVIPIIFAMITILGFTFPIIGALA